MHAGADRLKGIFQQELAALRDEAREFAQDFPEQANELGIHSGRSRDPHVEMLMQSFAYLTGRLRYQLEIDQTQLPNALMADLYPHMEGPLPSMLVAGIEVEPGQTYSKGVVLSRDRQVTATLPGDNGEPMVCSFRSCCETMLWPLRISDVTITSPEDYPDLLRKVADIRSVLRVRIVREGRETLTQLQPRQLRVFLNPEGGPAHALHVMLSAHLKRVAVHEEAQSLMYAPRMLPSDSLRWCGFDEGEAVLPGNPQAHPAYRFLQEYFAFPEKFLFFELNNLTVESASKSLDLLFLLDTPPDPSLRLKQSALVLNCVPMVNLFSQRIDPLKLDHTRYEYRLTGDIAQHRNCEIYRIESLHAIRPDGAPRKIAPYFGMDDFQSVDAQDYFYFLRREESQLARTGGTEIYISFLDANFKLTDPADEIVGGTALCTNRRTPERMRVGEPLKIEGAAPIADMRVLLRPTAHQSPTLTGARPWALVSQLSLNHLSLANGALPLAALKDLLRLHVGPASTLGHRAIDGLREIHCTPLMRWIHENGRRAYVQGLDIKLLLDHTHFEESSPILFADVLRRFFALYAAVNTVVQLRLEINNLKGTVKQWPPVAGAQVLL